jgi:hypothetical protein
MEGMVSQALQRLIGQIVQEQGFDGISHSALVEVEQQALQCKFEGTCRAAG